MKNETKNMESEEEAKREGSFAAESLAEEIEPLLKEYFIAESSMVGNQIFMQFPNGQKAKINVTMN